MQREKIIEECTAAVSSCWVHYVDNNIKLSKDVLDSLKWHLDRILPEEITTVRHDNYAAEYDKYVKNES